MVKKVISSFRVIGKVLEWMIFGVLIFLYLVVLSPNLPTKNYISTYIVQTGSMEPVVHTGSIALIQPKQADQVKKGDIIIFTSPKDPKQTILHRVFDIKQKDTSIDFETKGDNNNAPDNWVVPSISVKGVCIGTIPFVGHPAAFLKTPIGFAFLFGIPALFLVILQIKKIREGIEEEVQKRMKKQMQKEKMTDILSIIAILILTGLTSMITIQTVDALFTSRATVSGISFSVKDFTPPTTTVFIQGDLDETKNIIGTNGWHGYGWYESYDNVNLKIQTGDITNILSYQILSGDVSCPAMTDGGYTTGIVHDTNIAGVVNALPNGVHTLCYFGTNPPHFSESAPHKQLLKLDRENPAFTITGVSGTNMGGFYFNNTNTVSVTIASTDGFSGYTRGRFDLTYADASHNCTTNVPSGAISGYPGYNEDNLLPPNQSTSRTLTQTNIPNGNWCFRIWAYDDVQNKSGSQEVKVVIMNAPPVISNVHYLVATPEKSNEPTATISWNTDKDATSNLDWKTSPSSSWIALLDDTTSDRTSHMREIEGLLPETTYYFRVRSKDTGSNEVTSPTYSFQTSNARLGIDWGSDIVLNEFLPNPTGDDAAPMPGGEWVELYNRGTTPVDVSGWYVKDAGGHKLYITTGNSITSNPVTPGLLMDPKEFLVVYRNGGSFSLNNSSLGDSVILVRSSGWWADMHIYTGLLGDDILENKSFARFPDGSATWFDPIPSPGFSNILEEDSIQILGATVPSSLMDNQILIEEKPSLTLSLDNHIALFTVANISSFIHLSYEFSYGTNTELQGVMGSVDLKGENTFTKSDILLGICSTGGMCVYHEGVKNVKVTVTLKDTDGKESILEKTL